MVKQIAAIAILVSVVSLATVACGGSDAEEAAPPPPAAAAAPGATDAPAAEAQETVPVKSGVTGTDENGVIQYEMHVVGGGGTTGPKSSLHGSTPFNWEIAPFGQENPDLTFNVGDTVAFTVIPTADAKQSHTFSTKELGTIARMKYGKSATATLTFDKPGRFRYYCDIHVQEGMFGYITVE